MMQLPRLIVSGSARQMGQAQGEALREQIDAFVEQRLSALRVYLAERGQPGLASRGQCRLLEGPRLITRGRSIGIGIEETRPGSK